MSDSSTAARFLWTIKEDSSGNYTISATTNTFTPAFTSLPLTLLNHSLPTEHFYFSFNTTKAVIPPGLVTSDNTTCYYNSIVFQATLYTKMTTPSPTPAEINSSSTGKASGATSWPHAVQVVESARGDSDSPNCYDNQGNNSGIFLISKKNGICNCIHNNFKSNN